MDRLILVVTGLEKLLLGYHVLTQIHIFLIQRATPTLPRSRYDQV